MDIFSKAFTISSYDLNPEGRARLTTIANFFQEVAYHHANALGLGYHHMKDRKTMWVLSRMRIHMKRYPVWNENIRLETWPSGAEKLFALRDFRLMDDRGEVMGMASTAWLILDADSHRLIRPKEMMEQFKLIVHNEQVFERPLDKIVIPGEPRFLHQHRVTYSDLDIIGHVNNVKYIEWCIDAEHLAEKELNDICEMEINFNHEAMFGDQVKISAFKTPEDETYFKATREEDGKEIIIARFQRAPAN